MASSQQLERAKMDWATRHMNHLKEATKARRLKRFAANKKDRKLVSDYIKQHATMAGMARKMEKATAIAIRNL